MVEIVESQSKIIGGSVIATAASGLIALATAGLRAGLLVTLGIGIILFIGGEFLERRKRSKSKSDAASPQVNVTSINQSGGNTAHTINQTVNLGPPAPEVMIGPSQIRNQEFIDEWHGDERLYLTTFPVVVKSATSIDLGINASAPSVRQVTFTHFNGHGPMEHNSSGTPGTSRVVLRHAIGQMTLRVHTREPEENIKLEWFQA